MTQKILAIFLAATWIVLVGLFIAEKRLPCPKNRMRDAQQKTLRALMRYVTKRECEERWSRLPAPFGGKERKENTDPADFTSCGALFNMLRTCVVLATPDYGLEPLPNYYIAADHREAAPSLTSDGPSFDNKYRQAHIGFVHLPKTGGTSVESLLKRTVRGRYSGVRNCAGFAAAAAYNLLSYTEPDKVTLQNAILFTMEERANRTAAYRRVKTEATVRQVLTSKRNFGLHNFFSVKGSREFLYFVWFREPISKLLSFYHYLRSPKGSKGAKGHVYSVVVARESNTLTQFVHHPHIRRVPQLNNHFVRLLTFGEFPELDSQFDDMPESIASTSHSLPEIKEEHYLAARRNIVNKVAFIGITEEFTLSQQMLCFMLGIKCPQKSVKVNVNKHKEVPLGDKERKILEDLNYWDIRLYKDALSIFEKQKKAYFKMTNKKLP